MVEQSPAELQEHLAEQIQLLQENAKCYDNGIPAFAKMLAVNIRTLVHDGKGDSKSLLMQLKMKSEPFWNTSSERSQKRTNAYTGLVGVRLTDRPPRFVANIDQYDDIAKFIDFDDWWNGVIVVDLQAREMTRRELVHYVADNDGGAHVDRRLKDVYADFSRKNSIGVEYLTDGEWHPTEGADRASIRQIAHELLVTLKQSFPKPEIEAGSVTLHGSTVRATPIYRIPLANRKIGRNERCPCGSGRKYKRCCIGRRDSASNSLLVPGDELGF